MNEESKKFCIVNKDGYYVETINCFKDPKDNKRYVIPADAIDIEEPNIDKLADCMPAKLDENGTSWIYEEPIKPLVNEVAIQDTTMHSSDVIEHEVETPPHLQDDPMMFLRASRDIRLYKSDIEVLKCVEDAVVVSEDLKKYRKELRELPTNIESGFIPKPKHNHNADYDKGRSDPEEFIIFEHWPIYKK